MGDPPTPSGLKVVVMGVSGSGKTTVGERLADELGAVFVDADDVHPQANIDKMAAGVPLDDDDRAPWLAAIRDRLAAAERIVVTCSALERDYRDVLREADGVRFLHLRIDPATARKRVGGRSGHFMGPDMVRSQFEALEPPAADETDVHIVDASMDVEAVVQAALAAVHRGRSLRRSPARPGRRNAPEGRA